MNNVTSIEVWPKKKEKGAFQVKIVTLDDSRTSKWFNGEKIRPAQWLGLATCLYSRICRLIEQSARENKKVVWRHDQDFLPGSRISYDGAYAHEMRNREATN